MTIETLAAKHKLKTKKEGDEVIIPGKLGHIFMYDEDEGIAGAIFMPEEPSKGWKARREAFLKAGATLRQNGDTEGTVSFPAQRADIVKVAIKALGIYRKRRVDPAAKVKRLEGLKKAREAKKERCGNKHTRPQ